MLLVTSKQFTEASAATAYKLINDDRVDDKELMYMMTMIIASEAYGELYSEPNPVKALPALIEKGELTGMAPTVSKAIRKELRDSVGTDTTTEMLVMVTSILFMRTLQGILFSEQGVPTDD